MIERIKKVNWQDWVFAVGEVVFLVGLIPTVIAADKPSVWTSFPTAIMLFAFMVVQYSYKNWITFTLTFITASLWVTLGIQAL
jgi:hypothetical protein